MRIIAVPLAVLILAAGCGAMRSTTANTAVAELHGPDGKVVGNATLTEVTGGVRIVLDVRDLPPGTKGVHVHEVGRCEAPSFESARGHFNPSGRQHGLLNREGPHQGDLPNLSVGPNGAGRLETTTDRLSLGGGPHSVFDGDGSALVVHAKADDHMTDPAGNSGDRIACGAIVKPRAG
jgi:Cu-Zn family superoxide dismutase